MPTLREWVVELVVMLAVGIALAALGPFGSFEIGSFGARLAYWVPATLLGYAIFRPTTLAAILIARRLDLPELPAALVGSLVGAIPGTLAIAFFGGYRPGAEPNFEMLFQLYVQVGVIAILVMTVFILIGRSTRPAPIAAVSVAPVLADQPVSTDQVPTARFLDRLPVAWANQMIALEMEDHYVRAHGPNSSTLILLRMRDAEAELAGIDGQRVHRSWWVVRGAVDKVLRDGRGYKLRLTNGLEAPVARDRVAALKAARWID